MPARRARLADAVVVEPGRGALVEAAAAPGATGGGLSVITDLGRRHPVAADGVLPMLGYGKVEAGTPAGEPGRAGAGGCGA